MQRKRSTEEEESATAVQREMKENKTGEMRQALIRCVCFLNCCVRPCFLLLPSVAVTWFSCSEKSMTGGNGHLSLALLSFSASRRPPVGLHRFFGGGAVRGGVTGRPGIPEYWYFAFFSEGFRIYNAASKSRISTRHWLPGT